MAQRFLSLADLCEELAISMAQARALVKTGELPAIQVGGRNQWRVERTVLEEYIAQRYRENQERLKDPDRDPADS
ncbi:DNA binding domain-containing protein, excisionase family [Ruaniaceae bacterium KH17]|nr:DNA binding domain-containing protein, excisionase family [Ruaniaceae bacterium KH17]